MAEHIVVGVDGSAEARGALTWALREASLRHAVVEAIYAWNLPFLWALGVRPHSWPDPLALLEAAKQVLRGEVRLALESSEDHVPVEQIATEGHPAEVLIDASARAALLVVGARGVGGFRRLGLGSVSQHCVQEAHCPVVVVHLPTQ